MVFTACVGAHAISFDSMNVVSISYDKSKVSGNVRVKNGVN